MTKSNTQVLLNGSDQSARCHAWRGISVCNGRQLPAVSGASAISFVLIVSDAQVREIQDAMRYAPLEQRLPQAWGRHHHLQVICMLAPTLGHCELAGAILVKQILHHST